MGVDGFSKCHPGVNFLFFIGAICFGVVFQHPLYLAAGLLCAGCYYLLLNGHRAWKSMGFMLAVFLAITLINPLFNTQGIHVLFRVFGRPYTAEALGYGAAVGAVLWITLLWFGCYNHVMTEDKFVALFGNLAPSLSLLLVMILRLIPNLIGKAKQITHTRRCIGKGVQDAPVKDKLSAGMTVLLTLSGWALENGITTADSMTSRGYGSTKRTGFQSYRFRGSDKWLTVIMLACLLLTAYGAFTGSTETVYTPHFSAAPVSVFLPVYCLFLLIPTYIHIKEVLLCRIFISKI